MGEYFEPRLRMECMIELKNTLSKYGKQSETLNLMFEHFKEKNKDVVFVVSTHF